jgi:hypothetical protein
MSCRSGDKALGLSFVLSSGCFSKTVDLNAFTSQEKLLLPATAQFGSPRPKLYRLTEVYNSAIDTVNRSAGTAKNFDTFSGTAIISIAFDHLQPVAGDTLNKSSVSMGVFW